MVSAVEEGPETFMRKWHDAERCKAAERHAKAAAVASTVGISKRPRGEGRASGGWRGGGGEGETGEGGSGGRPAQETESLGLAIIVLKLVGLPVAVTSYRNASLTSSPCCVPLPVPLMHLIPSVNPMPNLVS